MPTPLTADVLQDELALSVARVLAAANKQARDAGVDVGQSLITISQPYPDDFLIWRVNYGPRDYIGLRGGDLIVEVNAANDSIHQVLRGQ
jgi:hypothetical protein